MAELNEAQIFNDIAVLYLENNVKFTGEFEIRYFFKMGTINFIE